MTPELYAIISVGISLGLGLGGGMLVLFREIASLRERMSRLEGELRRFMAGFRAQSAG